MFKKETDPSKLGKALGDSINRKTIIGVLLMLMILPLFTLPEIDYSGEYALRDAFWFGRSSCKDPNGFFCSQEEWITSEGWQEILRGMTRNAQERVMEDGRLTTVNKKELLWLYLPDFEKNGAMDEIKEIKSKNPDDPPFWTQNEICGGF